MPTKHSHGANFGRRVEGCPRCAELDAGAKPIEWRGSARVKARENARHARELEAHFASDKHRGGGCGPVCTFGDW